MNICQLRIFGEPLAPRKQQAGGAARAIQAGAIHMVAHRRAADIGQRGITRRLPRLHTTLISGAALCAVLSTMVLARRTAACLLLRRRLRMLSRRDTEHML